MNPLVSIITPMYNSEKFIEETILSVISQTYINWEMLIIDDGSKDKSISKVNHWQNKDSRIKLFFHENHANKGVSATRNLGIKNARGKYIALLDSDDLWLPKKLTQQVRILEENPAIVLTYCKAITIDQNNIPINTIETNAQLPSICGIGKNGIIENAFEQIIQNEIWIPCLTALMKKDAIKKINGFYEHFKYQVEDQYLFTLLSLGGGIYFTDSIISKYRIHSDSYTTNTNWEKSYFEYYHRLYNSISANYYEAITKGFVIFWINYLTKIRRKNMVEFCFIVRALFKILFNFKISIKHKAIFVRQFFNKFLLK